PSRGSASRQSPAMWRESPAPPGAPGPRSGPPSSRPAPLCRRAAAPLRRPPPWPAPRGRRTRPPYRPAASHLQSTEPVEAKSPDYLVDIGPAPVALEDHLAWLASEHDLELPPTDGGSV